MVTPRVTLGIVITLLLLSHPQSVFAERLFSSGCEFQGDTGGDAVNDLEWELDRTSADTTQISNTIKRSGNSSCMVTRATNGRGAFYHKLSSVDSSNPTFFRFYFYIGQMPSEVTEIAAVDKESLFQEYGEQSIALGLDGRLVLRGDEGAQFLNGTKVLNTGQWYRIEWQYDVGGSTEVRVDGIRELYAPSHDGDSFGYLELGICMVGACSGGTGTGTFYFDDIAVNDTNGAYQNSWPGEGSIFHLQPNSAGDGNGCSIGNWSDVSEITPDDASSFCNLDNNSGGDILDVSIKSPYEVGIDPRDTIALVHVGVREAAQSASSESWEPRIKSRSAATVQAGSSTSHDDTTYKTNGDSAPQNYKLTSYIDPSTGCPWNQYGTNSLDNAQIGINVTDGNPDVRVSTLWALVEVNTQFQKPCSQATNGNPPVPITTALSKTSTYKQIKSGGLWANAIAADKICLGNDQNCTADWSPPAACRLETYRAAARKDYPFTGVDFLTPGSFFLLPPGTVYNISTNSCDGLLSSASVAAGWVSTGYDYTNRYKSGALAGTRVCQFMRLACDGRNVAVGPGVSTAPLPYPVADFTTSTNQCSDGINNSDGDSDVDYPADLQCSSWSDNDESS